MQPGIQQCPERLALGRRDVRRDALHDRRVAVVGVGRGDVEVAREGESEVGLGAQRVGRVSPERLEPREFVGVVRVVEATPVRHVQAPQLDAADRRADRAGLLRGIRPLVALRESRHAGEADLQVFDRLTARDRDAVPLVQSVRFDGVPGRFELGVGELLGLALDLLHEEDVDVFPHTELDRPDDAGADRVDVPGRDAHGIQPTVAADAARPDPRRVTRSRRRVCTTQSPRGRRGPVAAGLRGDRARAHAGRLNCERAEPRTGLLRGAAGANGRRSARQRARRMSSTRCLASPKSICVLSRKKSGFCTPA